MPTRTKEFNCLIIKREGQERVQRRLAGMSRDDELAYWKRREEALLAWQEALRRGIDAPFPAEDDGDRHGRTAD
jgi:hypothetical protein